MSLAASGFLSPGSLIVGGVTYAATSRDFAASIFGDNINAVAGVPFQSFVGGVLGYTLYRVFHDRKFTWHDISTGLPVGLYAMIGSVVATGIASSNMAPVGAALGAVWEFNQMGST